MTGKIIRVRTDNEAVAHIVNTGRSKDLLLQKVLRELTWWLARYNFGIKAVHLSGKLNRMPDILSRWHEGQMIRDQFYQLGGEKLNRVNVAMHHIKYTHDW